VREEAATTGVDSMEKAGPWATGTQTARYIERISKELKGLANDSELAFLGYLLGMVQEEAATAAIGTEPKGARKRARTG